jgi:hypothetical protein
MIDLILKAATGARAVVAAAALGLGGTLLFRLSPYEAIKSQLDGASLPEETITSPDRFAAILEALGVAGRATYLQFQVWDLMQTILLRPADAPLVAADLLENLIIAMGIGAYPEPASVVKALPLVTAVKFGGAMATMVTVVLLALMWLRDRVSGVLRRAP